MTGPRERRKPALRFSSKWLCCAALLLCTCQAPPSSGEGPLPSPGEGPLLRVTATSHAVYVGAKEVSLGELDTMLAETARLGGSVGFQVMSDCDGDRPAHSAVALFLKHHLPIHVDSTDTEMSPACLEMIRLE